MVLIPERKTHTHTPLTPFGQQSDTTYPEMYLLLLPDKGKYISLLNYHA